MGTEDGRPLVESTIDSLLANPATRRDIKADFASLTIGSGSAAIVLCDRRLSRAQTPLFGGTFRTDTESHELCKGGDAAAAGDSLRMHTDAEALLLAGTNLAADTWCETKRLLGWSNDNVQKVVTHQVGRAHRKLLFERLGLDPSLDSPTVEYLGNTGAAAVHGPLPGGRAESHSIGRPRRLAGHRQRTQRAHARRRMVIGRRANLRRAA